MPELAAHLERVAKELADVLGVAWGKYIWLFHEAPHGTEKQVSALLALGVEEWLAAALAACAREAGEPLLAYVIHKNTCKGFPAFSEAQLARDCDCGLQAIKNRLKAS